MLLDFLDKNIFSVWGFDGIFQRTHSSKEVHPNQHIFSGLYICKKVHEVDYEKPGNVDPCSLPPKY